MSVLMTHHRRCVAREVAASVGLPLRDRWGNAARDQDVDFLVDAVLTNESDEEVGEVIGLANAVGQICLCEGYDEHLSEEAEQLLAKTVREALK